MTRKRRANSRLSQEAGSPAALCRSTTPTKPEAFTERELKERHTYLLKYRWFHLEQVIHAVEDRFTAQGRPPKGWQILQPYSRGRAFTYDVAAALEALGPDVEPIDSAEQRQRDAFAEKFKACVAAHARSRDWDEQDIRAWLHARDSEPELYQRAFGSPPPPVNYSQVWRAAELAALANAALACVDVEAMIDLDRAVRQHELALLGDTAALKALDEARKAPRRYGKVGGTHGRGKVKRPHTALIRRAADQLERAGHSVSPRAIRALLRQENVWRYFAYEQGDPLHDIVRVEVDETGSGAAVLYIEYTAAYARRHRHDCIVPIDNRALKRALERRPAK